MKKRIFTVFLGAVMALSLFMGFVGCGGGDDDYTPTDVVDWDKIDWEGKNDTSTTINVVLSQQFRNYYDDLLAEFAVLHPEYKVNPIYAANAIDKQNTDIGAKNAPDVFIGGDAYVNEYKGLMIPLNKLIERDDAEVDSDDFLPHVLDALSSNGYTYFLPEYVNVGVLYYNKTLFDNDSLAYPEEDWTYEDFTATAKLLTKDENKDLVYEQWGVFNNFTWWGDWLPLTRYFGAEMFGDEGYVTLNTPEAIEAFEAYAQWTGTMQKPETWGNKISAGPTEDQLGGFEGGKCAMLYGGNVGNWVSYTGVSLDWDIQKLPVNPETGKSGAEFSVQGYGIFKGSKNIKGSWELIKFLTRKRSTVAELNAFGYPTPRTSGKELLLAVPKEQRAKPQNLEALFETIEEGLAMTLPAQDYFIDIAQNKINPYIVKLLNGEISAEKCAKDATSQANFYIDNFYKLV